MNASHQDVFLVDGQIGLQECLDQRLGQLVDLGPVIEYISETHRVLEDADGEFSVCPPKAIELRDEGELLLLGVEAECENLGNLNCVKLSKAVLTQVKLELDGLFTNVLTVLLSNGKWPVAVLALGKLQQKLPPHLGHLETGEPAFLIFVHIGRDLPVNVLEN